ncbi:MAG: YggS family pyridoxal phosphate-dependent enzyme [Eubacteriales bacterium]|jgi:pyridoxal phosphate enzyme (YggS family)|nr:YggS family pyridoxal phosphate-dependent enzyme [Eubacteriales bacterium]
MTDKLSDNSNTPDNINRRCMTVAENWRLLQDNINEIKRANGITYDITVCAATKNVPVEIINFAAGLGLKRIGENRVNELLKKYDKLDTEHLTADYIGTLQTNKIGKLIGRVSLIQSLDSYKAAKEIDRISKIRNCVTDVLVEINSGREPNKGGIMPETYPDFMESVLPFDNINIRGIMTVGPFCEKREDIRIFFKETYRIFIDFYQKKIDNIDNPILSMGMSSNYDIAIECGANMIRPGTALFGERTD